MSNLDIVRAHIIFSGTVQGIGFRFMAQQYAVGFDLTGWVKNLPDGSVEIFAEGPKKDIEELCRNIESYFEGHIRHRNIEFSPSQSEFKSFKIAA